MAASTPSANTISSRALVAQEALLKAIKSRKSQDIEASVHQWDPIASSIPPNHPDYEPVLASYAVALLLRWEESHQQKDIRKAIMTLENALTCLANIPSRNRYQNLANLGAAYMDRYERTQKDPKDILRAAECWEQAHAISVSLGFMRESASKILTNLGEAYFYAYEVSASGPEAVELAIKTFQSALTHGSKENQGGTRYRVGQCYSALYGRRRQREDLDAAIENLRAATEHELEDEDRQGALMELSRTLARRYDLTREEADLNDAIHWAKMALEENQGEPSILRNLANLLYWKYKDLKDQAALDQAIEYYEVIYALYQNKPGRSLASFYYSFGTALIRRFDAMEGQNQGRMQDIERAIDLMEWAVRSATPECLDDYQHRLKGARSRRDRLVNRRTSSPPATMRSSNTIGFPSQPASPTAISFAEQQELPKRSSTLRRAPIPSLSSHPDTPGSSSTVIYRISKDSDTRSRSGSRSSEAPSESTIIPMRQSQPAPSIFSESMSVMSVPAVQDLPPMDIHQARPRVLRRATKGIPIPTLAKSPASPKLGPSPPEKPRREFLSFVKLRTPKSTS
ncbi:hypothetical protein FRC14_002824 [Serendipita sp. 396]|nr:hypothetical protein FRC14_002824 [Serendipita sp. 396]KAG8784956.1 hypothetical protein FRC15_002293 [Serendipita sp. 397]KAG8823789.1 hypothetical protein FRC19_003139 [Serendipita sp. 401]KAG8837778.1 hypothetical protein FRC18_008040 [Serendipita sp. 400]KAG8859931.1 hypothetical protein FRB91_005801 [Serendipita sp. 411]KAG8868587.1 hypothetical protein FRC20_003105 [Serendipita sp. 405]